MEFIYVGKIVNTFGIKGELKIVSRFEMASKVFKVNNHLRINNNDYLITGVRFHKNNYLIELNNIKDINDINHLINYDVFFRKTDLNLKAGEYLISELIGYKVFDNDTFIGIITDYDDNKINPLVKVDNKFYIPLKGEYLLKVDKENQKIFAHNLKGLML
jgi:16S rRNA processing protein RimM